MASELGVLEQEAAMAPELQYAELVRQAKAAQSLRGYKDRRMQVKSPWNPANLLVATDYDFTCTEDESCELLVRAKESAMDISDCRIMKAYLGLWDEYEQALPCAVQLPSGTTPLRHALGRLAGLELAINGKVMAAGLLSGLRWGAIRSAGEGIALQPGCLQVLLQFASLGTAVHVISANWSRDLVLGGLSAIPEHLLFVHCNDLEFDSKGVSTGWFQSTITNAFDKERVLQALRRMSGQNKMVVYLGDDQPDTLALLDADLGIVMGATDALRTLLDQSHIQLQPLQDAAALLATGTVSSFRHTRILFQASSWDDVSACLF